MSTSATKNKKCLGAFRISGYEAPLRNPSWVEALLWGRPEPATIGEVELGNEKTLQHGGTRSVVSVGERQTPSCPIGST